MLSSQDRYCIASSFSATAAEEIVFCTKSAMGISVAGPSLVLVSLCVMVYGYGMRTILSEPNLRECYPLMISKCQGELAYIYLRLNARGSKSKSNWFGSWYIHKWPLL